MHPNCKIIIQSALAILLGLPTSALGGGWKALEGFIDADAVADQLASEIASRLKREGSMTIILQQTACQGEASWCQALMSNIERTMVHKGIQFLPEAQRESIRNQIAEEGLYQQSSEMVDASKATEIGKQEAVQAFVGISVTAESEDKVLIEARSIRMSSGTVTIKEGVRLARKKELSTSFGNYAKGLGWMGIGLGLATMGAQQAWKYKKASSESYSRYNETKDPHEAKKYREQTKKNDSYQTAAGGVAGIGICMTIYGYTRFSAEQSEVSYYRVDSLTNNRTRRSSLQALVSTGFVSMLWAYNF